MKIKAISRVIAILLTVVAIICLTSCEDESNIPDYGIGLSEEKSSLSPKSFVYLDDSHVDGYMLCLHLTIGNANSPMTANELVSVKVVGGDGEEYIRPNYDKGDYIASNISESILDYGYKYHIVYAFTPIFTNSDTATVTVTDRYSGEVIGEWDVDTAGIMD